MTDVGTIEEEANKDDDHISLGLYEEEQAEGHDEDSKEEKGNDDGDRIRFMKIRGLEGIDKRMSLYKYTTKLRQLKAVHIEVPSVPNH